jgi:DNA-binding PadR family transcriptional regulator
MTRLFGRGQLQLALLNVAADLGPANGYSIMHALDERIGGSWRPSPGAIYPALLALEDAGLLRGADDGGARRYVLTDAGQRALHESPDVIGEVASRAAEAATETATFGALLDRLAAAAPSRQLRLDAAGVRLVEDRFGDLVDHVTRTTSKETT